MFSRLNENQLVLFVMDRGHSKSMLVVQGGSLKSELKRTEEGGERGGVSSLSVCWLCETNKERTREGEDKNWKFRANVLFE